MSSFERETPPYEKKDLAWRGVLVFLISVFLLIAFSLAGTRILTMVFQHRWQKTDYAPPPFEARALPPEPRLQENPRDDLKKMKAQENALLSTTGWIDPQNGIVRIPIERAMELVVKEGLPARHEARNP